MKYSAVLTTVSIAMIKLNHCCYGQRTWFSIRSVTYFSKKLNNNPLLKSTDNRYVFGEITPKYLWGPIFNQTQCIWTSKQVVIITGLQHSFGTRFRLNKVKVSHTWYKRWVRSWSRPLGSQPAGESKKVIHPAVSWHYFPLGLLKNVAVAVLWPVPNYTAWWHRHMCVNNLPRVDTWKRNGRDSNPVTFWSRLT